MSWLFLLSIFILCFIAAVFYWTIFRRLQKILIRSPRYDLRRSQDIPAHLIPLFELPIERLSQAGFEPIAALELQPLTDRGPGANWEMLLFHPQWNTYAHVSLRQPMEPTHWYQVAFHSFFGDRSLLLTVNGAAHNIIHHLPNTTLRDDYTADLMAQWEGHRQALQHCAEPAIRIPRPVYAPALEAHYSDYLQHLWDEEQIFPRRDRSGNLSGYRLAPWGALQTTWKICRSQSKAFALRQQYAVQARQEPSHRIEVPVELEVENFERMQRLEAESVKPGQGWRGRGWIFWASLGLFILSFRTYVDGWSLLVFVAAIAFHEGGHYWAMRWLGYDATSVVFLPFLGAAATGHKPNASLTEKIMVLLAGPLPGLVLGVLLLLVSPVVSPVLDQWTLGLNLGGLSGWAVADVLNPAAAILIGLNLFNLLPIYPLDGGKVAHLLLFSRLPWADLVFKGAAVVGLALLGFVSPVLWILAVAVGFSIPESFRSARLQALLARRLRGGDRAFDQQSKRSSLRQIFQTLQDSGYGRLAFSDRYLMAKDLLERRQELQATWFKRFALGLLYLLCLTGSPVGAIYAYRQTLNIPAPVVASPVMQPETRSVYSSDFPSARPMAADSMVSPTLLVQAEGSPKTFPGLEPNRLHLSSADTVSPVIP